MTPDRAAARTPAPPMTAEQAREAVAARTAQLDRRLEAAAGAREQIAAVRVRATSADGLVEVEVSARGTLLDLRLAPAAAGVTPDRLAAEVLRTVREASARAAEQVRAVLEPALAPGTDLDALVLDPAVPLDAPERPRAVPADPDDDYADRESWLRAPAGGSGR